VAGAASGSIILQICPRLLVSRQQRLLRPSLPPVVVGGGAVLEHLQRCSCACRIHDLAAEDRRIRTKLMVKCARTGTSHGTKCSTLALRSADPGSTVCAADRAPNPRLLSGDRACLCLRMVPSPGDRSQCVLYSIWGGPCASLEALSATMAESELEGGSGRLAGEYGVRVFRRASWTEDELQHLTQGVEDLCRLMGGSAGFRRQLHRVFVWRVPWRTWMAAMAVPLLDVVYFKGASWGDPPELKWQTVHELAHVWDIRSFYRLSRGFKKASGSSYGRLKWRSPIPFEYDPGDGWLEGRKPPLNALEDWAESVATYVYADHAESARGGPRLISPARWDYVQDQMSVRLAYPAQWIPHFHGPEGPGPASV